MVSFSCAPGPCLIHTEMVKGSFRLVLTMPSGTLMAWVPLNSNTWSLSCPLSVGSPTVQLAELLGAGRSSMVPELAPKKTISQRDQSQLYWKYILERIWSDALLTIPIFSGAITYHTACAAISQSKCHDRSPFQYGWFPVQHWLGWMWLAHHRSPSACLGKGPDYLCQVRIQSSYWNLKDEAREEGKNEKMSFSTAQITHEQSMQRLSIVIMH